MDTVMTEEQIREHVLAGKLVFEKMGPEGDIKSIWDPSNADEVDSARQQFHHMVNEKRYLAFRVEADGDKGERMYNFDKTAGRVILVPPMVAG